MSGASVSMYALVEYRIRGGSPLRTLRGRSAHGRRRSITSPPPPTNGRANPLLAGVTRHDRMDRRAGGGRRRCGRSAHLSLAGIAKGAAPVSRRGRPPRQRGSRPRAGRRGVGRRAMPATGLPSGGLGRRTAGVHSTATMSTACHGRWHLPPARPRRCGRWRRSARGAHLRCACSDPDGFRCADRERPSASGEVPDA